jgi:hypothetical protein
LVLAWAAKPAGRRDIQDDDQPTADFLWMVQQHLFSMPAAGSMFPFGGAGSSARRWAVSVCLSIFGLDFFSNFSYR